MNFLKSTFITFFTNIFIFSISIVTTIITSRMLGPSGKGTLGVANNVLAFGLLILGFGLEAANIYFVGKNKKGINSVVGYNFIVAAFSFIILILLCIVNSFYSISILFKGLDNRIIIVLVFTIPLTLIKSGFTNILLGLQEIVNYNKISMLDRIVTFIILVISVFIFKSPFYIILSSLISTIIIQVILCVILFKKYNVKFNLNKKMSREMLSYGFKSQIANTIQMLNYRLDIFIINYYLPIAQVGIYTNAVALGETMWQVSGTVATLIYPMTASAQNQSELKDFINKITRITLHLVGICSLVLILISRKLILILFGRDFSASADSLILLIPGIWLFSISKILANYIAGMGKVEKNIFASSISCIATVILDIMLIPRIGIIGASIATSISYIIFTGVILTYYMKMTGSTLKEICIITRDDVKLIKAFIVGRILKKKA